MRGVGRRRGEVANLARLSGRPRLRAETSAAQNYRATYVTTTMLRKALQDGVSGEDGAIAFLKALNVPEPNPARYHLDEGYLNAAGYALINYNKLNEAIELLNFLFGQYPHSANAYDSLGEAYMNAGNNELAIENYKKSLELNPDNQNAKTKLEELQK